MRVQRQRKRRVIKREGEGYVSVVVRFAKPPEIPEEIARRYPPVSREAPASRVRWHSGVRWKGCFAYSLLRKTSRGTFLVVFGGDDHPDMDDVVTRQDICPWKFAAAQDFKSPVNSGSFKRLHVSSHFMCVCVCESACQFSNYRNIDISISLHCSVCISLSRFDELSIAIGCARSKFDLLL